MPRRTYSCGALLIAGLASFSNAAQKVSLDDEKALNANYQATPKALFFVEKEEGDDLEVIKMVQKHFHRRMVVSVLFNSTSPRSKFCTRAVSTTLGQLDVVPDAPIDFDTCRVSIRLLVQMMTSRLPHYRHSS